MSMVDLIKVQRPIITNDETVPWLVYDKHHKRQQQIPQCLIPASVIKAMGETDLKGYFWGQWSSVTGWKIGNRVRNQEW